MSTASSLSASGGAGAGADASSASTSSVVARTCAYCLAPAALRCGRCRNRAYCSAECQKADWGKGRGQCHKSWCGIRCGEKEVDWEIKFVPSRGRKGIFAKRDFKPDERVFVERMYFQEEIDETLEALDKTLTHTLTPMLVKQSFRDLDPAGMGPTEKFDRHACPITEMNGALVLPLNLSLVNHACKPNSEWVFDPTDTSQPTLLLITGAPVAAGEEFTVTFTWTIGISANSVPPEMAAAALFSTWGIVCPPDCACKDATIMGKVARVHALERRARELCAAGHVDEGLRAAEQFLDMANELGLSSIQRTRGMDLVINIAVAREATMPRARQLLAQKHALCMKLYGSKSYFTRQAAADIANPTAFDPRGKFSR